VANKMIAGGPQPANRRSRPGRSAANATPFTRVTVTGGRARLRAFALTAAQLAINQRIGQSAVRRLNGVRARMAGSAPPVARPRVSRGVVTFSARQLRINQRIYQAAVRRAAALEAALTGAPVPIGSPRSPGQVRLTVGQLRINQRIAQAAVRRANDLAARVT